MGPNDHFQWKFGLAHLGVPALGTSTTRHHPGVGMMASNDGFAFEGTTKGFFLKFIMCSFPMKECAATGFSFVNFFRVFGGLFGKQLGLPGCELASNAAGEMMTCTLVSLMVIRGAKQRSLHGTICSISWLTIHCMKYVPAFLCIACLD